MIGLLWTIFGDLGELKNQHVIDTMMSSKPPLLLTAAISISFQREDVAPLVHILFFHALSSVLQDMPTLVVSSTSGLDDKKMEGEHINIQK